MGVRWGVRNCLRFDIVAFFTRSDPKSVLVIGETIE